MVDRDDDLRIGIKTLPSSRRYDVPAVTVATG